MTIAPWIDVRGAHMTAGKPAWQRLPCKVCRQLLHCLPLETGRLDLLSLGARARATLLLRPAQGPSLGNRPDIERWPSLLFLTPAMAAGLESQRGILEGARDSNEPKRQPGFKAFLHVVGLLLPICLSCLRSKLTCPSCKGTKSFISLKVCLSGCRHVRSDLTQ